MKTILLPEDLYDRVAELANADHVSVDRLVATLVSERIDDWSRLHVRAERGSLEKLRAVLAKVSDAPPEEADRR
jgi:hypothetical protein